MLKRKNSKINTQLHPAFYFVGACKDFLEYEHKKNGLRVILHYLPQTKVITANIVYKVGSRNELPGKTGLAHMLEHMLFKPTKTNLEQNRSASIMDLERNTGAIINASTWRDRTNYYCTAPTEQLANILKLEADRMRNVVITDKNLKSERANVLSECDMYNSNPYFALEVAVSGAAFLAHPYRHETIGWRSDIETYTAKDLNDFYATFYTPNNATLIIIGDTTPELTLLEIDQAFGKIKKEKKLLLRMIKEPTQEGIRRTTIVRKTTTNLLSIATKGYALGSQNWLNTEILFRILGDGPDSILHRLLVDTGKITAVEISVNPTVEAFLATITCTLVNNHSHTEIEKIILQTIRNLTARDLLKPLQKTVAQILYTIPFVHDSSNSIANELTEYIATADWHSWCQTEKLIKTTTGKDLIAIKNKLFVDYNLTIGYFVGEDTNKVAKNRLRNTN